MLNIEIRKIKSVAVIECTGIIQKVDESTLNNCLLNLIEDGFTDILFDWSAISYFDSMGLENLISIYKNFEDIPDIRIGVLITDDVLCHVYKTLRFDKIFPLFSNLSEALDNLKQTEEAKTD